MKRTLLFLLSCISFAGGAAAQNKGLDLSFGNGGIAQTSIYTNKKFKTPTGLIIQPDGKILISGNFIARYKTDGTPDSTFATNGFFLPPNTYINSSSTPVNSRAVVLLGDGKILMAGKWDSSCYYIARLLPDGKIDGSFGQNGISRSNLLDVWNILVQPDGKILAIGNGCGNVNSPQDSVFIERYTATGYRDSSFGRNGYTKAYLGNYGGSITNMGLLSDGRIAMGGIGSDSGFIALRFLPNGALDTSLGGRGRIFPFYAWYCHGLAVLSDGRMVFTLADLNYEDVTRLNTDGTPDTTFGDGGFISIDGQSTLSILPLSDGRILCGGIRQGDYAIACLKPNGKGLDSSFGQNGSITTDMTGYWEDYLRKIALQGDNKIVGVGDGTWDKNTPAGVMLVRYNTNAAVGVKSANTRVGSNITLYPNPARDKIEVRSSEKGNLYLYDLMGRSVYSIAINKTGSSVSFDISGLTAGIYQYKFMGISGQCSKGKLLITR